MIWNIQQAGVELGHADLHAEAFQPKRGIPAQHLGA